MQAMVLDAPGTKLRLADLPEPAVAADEILLKVPVDRTSPPSEPSKNCIGLLGLTTSACWSGWIEFPATAVLLQQLPAGGGAVVASRVWSVQLAPAFLDKRTPRAFDTVFNCP